MKLNWKPVPGSRLHRAEIPGAPLDLEMEAPESYTGTLPQPPALYHWRIFRRGKQVITGSAATFALAIARAEANAARIIERRMGK